MIFKAPENIAKRDFTKPSLFLAGTIDMGNSEDWQAEATTIFYPYFNIFNPRRDDWDASWSQVHDNPQFFQQVSWELNALEVADVILMNFLPDSISPISLLELGLYARSKKMVVICPEGFNRSGNVHVVCERYDVPIVGNLKAAVNPVYQLIKKPC